MKKIILSYLLIISSLNAENILLFTCNYGAGHKMATQGIIESLPEYTIEVVDIYSGPLKSLDPLRTWAPSFCNEKLYNDFAKNEYNRFLNFMSHFAPNTLLFQRKGIEKELNLFIEQKKPDLLISCIPLVNSMLYNVADHLNIPLLVITTDIDISAFCFGFEPPYPSKWNRFRMTVPYAEEKYGTSYLKESYQLNFGYPTRKAFSASIEEEKLDEIRKEYEINNDENVILIMMGGNTAKAARTYAKLLLAMNNQELDQITENTSRAKIHVLCLCGDVSQMPNRLLLEELNQLNARNNPRVRIHAVPGTTKIAELVSLPEMRTVISKPGGSTVNEMIKKKTPMVYHISDVPLDWEEGNRAYGEARNLGKQFQTKGKARALRKNLVDVLTYTFSLQKQMRENPDLVPEAKIDFASNLKKTVNEMIH